MDKFYKINVKDQKPEVSGWYDTDKGRVFFHNKGEFSCRKDRISEEYPTWWLKKDSNQEMQEFDKWKSNKLWFYLDDGDLYKNGQTGELKSFSELFKIFEKETSK